MTTFDLLLQQTINGLSLGAMYALLALGFTLVYGILELINFSHFNVFMVGSFVALFVLQEFGLSGQEVILTGLPLAGVLLATFLITMAFCGGLGVVVERITLRPLRNVKGPAAMITSIGVSYILFNVILLTVGANSKNFPNPLPTIRWQIGGATLDFRVVLIWGIALLLMATLYMFVQRSRIGSLGLPRDDARGGQGRGQRGAGREHGPARDILRRFAAHDDSPDIYEFARLTQDGHG